MKQATLRKPKGHTRANLKCCYRKKTPQKEATWVLDIKQTKLVPYKVKPSVVKRSTNQKVHVWKKGQFLKNPFMLK